MPIRVLSSEVAGKIAAGEVVDRPASVAKELVENSIDAGATEIRIEIREGGRRLIRVADNGGGIPADEVPLAFARHATSKLAQVSDLEQISTLGFRGEALASIAAVSQTSLLSRPREQAVGQYLRVDNGRIVQQEGRGGPAGTVVTVEHLFRNLPARLKFLRQAQTEAGHIHRVVTHYALAHPSIRIRLTVDGREAFQSSGNGVLYDVLIAVYGLEMAEQMWSIAEPDRPEDRDSRSSERPSSPVASHLTVSGYVGHPALHRASRDYVGLFVNGRWIQDRSLLHAVSQAYHTLQPVGRHPVAVILLEIDPTEVDVNVHPTKREVKFRDGHRVFGAVEKAVRKTLVENAAVPLLAGSSRTWPSPDWEGYAGPIGRRLEGAGPTQLAIDLYRPPDAGLEPEPVGPVRLPLLRVVGQVGQTYIVAEGPQGMYLIDQHAAHERVLYDQFKSQRRPEAQMAPAQVLLEPVTLELDPLLAGLLAENLAVLNEVGFDVSPFGSTSYLIRAVPSILTVPDVRAAVTDILEMLRNAPRDDPLVLRAEDRLIAAICKRAAIKAGQTLSADEMQRLVRQLEQSESPRTCPHGRPTILHFSVDHLEKQFGRR